MLSILGMAIYVEYYSRVLNQSITLTALLFTFHRTHNQNINIVMKFRSPRATTFKRAFFCSCRRGMCALISHKKNWHH